MRSQRKQTARRMDGEEGHTIWQFLSSNSVIGNGKIRCHTIARFGVKSREHCFNKRNVCTCIMRARKTRIVIEVSVKIRRAVVVWAWLFAGATTLALSATHLDLYLMPTVKHIYYTYIIIIVCIYIRK